MIVRISPGSLRAVPSVVTLDPGTDRAALAVFSGSGALIATVLASMQDEIEAKVVIDIRAQRAAGGLVQGLATLSSLNTLALLSEFPFNYPGGARRGDGNDLLPLAYQVGLVAAHFPAAPRLYRPREWKGTVEKSVMCNRIFERLVESERQCLAKLDHARKEDHNVLDAVGIGLRYFGRLGSATCAV